MTFAQLTEKIIKFLFLPDGLNYYWVRPYEWPVPEPKRIKSYGPEGAVCRWAEWDCEKRPENIPMYHERLDGGRKISVSTDRTDEGYRYTVSARTENNMESYEPHSSSEWDWYCRNYRSYLRFSAVLEKKG